MVTYEEYLLSKKYALATARHANYKIKRLISLFTNEELRTIDINELIKAATGRQYIDGGNRRNWSFAVNQYMEYLQVISNAGDNP